MILHGPQIWRWIVASAGRCNHRAWVASAFVTARRFELLDRELDPSVRSRVLVVRWQLSDLLRGASDLRVYEIAKQSRWRVLVNLGLHGKGFLFDRECLVGSANLTDKGMFGVPPSGNREIASVTSDIGTAEAWFGSLLELSPEVDDGIFARIRDAVLDAGEIPNVVAVDNLEYGQELQRSLAVRRTTELFTYDLFWGSPPVNFSDAVETRSQDPDCDHDLSLLGVQCPSSWDAIETRFLDSKGFQWLLSVADEQEYFGSLVAKLQNALCDDPAPFRKDVKSLLGYLLRWTSMFGGSYFHIDRPNVSERITRIGPE